MLFLCSLKNAQLAGRPLLLLGGAAPTALQGRCALQDIDQRPLVAPHVKRVFRARRVRALDAMVSQALQLAAGGVPAPVFVECPVDLLYDDALVRQWYADAAGKGTSLADRALRWYLSRHAARMFDGAAATSSPPPAAPVVPYAGDGTVARAANALAGAQRPLAVIGSQAVLAVERVREIAAAIGALGIPVYLSGMARGLLGRDHPLQLRHACRDALRESDCVLAAGVPCDLRLDYGRHVRRSATLIAANRSRKDARLNRRPDVAAIGDAGPTLLALAAQTGARAHRPIRTAVRMTIRPDDPQSAPAFSRARR